MIIPIEGQVSYVASMATVLQSFMSSFVPFYLQVSTSMFYSIIYCMFAEAIITI